MRRLFLVLLVRPVLGRGSMTGSRRLMAGGGVVFMELFGAIRAFEFMPFAGNTSNGDGQDEQEKTFHRGAS